jgi:hypothetical protein
MHGVCIETSIKSSQDSLTDALEKRCDSLKCARNVNERV